MMLRKIFMCLLLVIVFTIGGIKYAIAQADPGDPGDDPDRIPLDPGSWVLVAAGVGYGIKKWRDARQNPAPGLNRQEINTSEKLD